MTTIDGATVVVVSLLNATFICLVLRRHVLDRYFWLIVYTGAALAADGVRMLTIYLWGFPSREYFIMYYLSDFSLIALSYIVILSLLDLVLKGSPTRGRFGRAVFLCFTLMVVASAGPVWSLANSFRGRAVVVLERNLNLTGTVLTFLLWAALISVKSADRKLHLFVLGMGFGASLQAMALALRNPFLRELFQADPVARRLVPWAWIGMLAIWCYALATSRPQPGLTSPDRDVRF